MTVHNLSDFPYQYTTKDEESPKTEKYYQNDPNHNVEPKSHNKTEWNKELGAHNPDIMVFSAEWGYTGNSGIKFDLLDLLTAPKMEDSDITLFFAEWGITSNTDKAGMRNNLKEMRANREKSILAASDKARKASFKAEADKRVERFFIGQQGEVWIVWHISDIPSKSDDPDYKHITEKSPITGNSWGFASNDGMLTMVTASLHFTRERAMDSIREDVSYLTQYDLDPENKTLSHVYELDTFTA